MTLDELLLEWSYRSEKGYPSLGNPSDVLILEKILNQLTRIADYYEAKGKREVNKEIKVLKEKRSSKRKATSRSVNKIKND